MKMRLLCRLMSVFLFVAVFGTCLPAHADLMIAPLRVEMADRNRSADIHLVNTSDKTNTYRVAWRHMRMDENGVYTRLEESLTPFDLAAAARVAPRQITLKPGERQVVRLSIRRPADLSAGEYRSHLVFQNMGSDPAGPAPQEVDGIQMAIQMNVGHAIPVIYRVGSSDVKITITSAFVLKDERGPYLDLILKREGLHGSGGRLAVERIDAPQAMPVRPMDYFNIFAEVPKRSVKVRLPEDIRSGERLRIVYSKDSGAAQGNILADKIVSVP